MTTSNPEENNEAEITALRQKAELLERRLLEIEADAAARIRLTELKAEALRAGIIDIDGLRLLDPGVTSGQATQTQDAAEIIARLRVDKPWLFSPASTSSPSVAPKPVQAKRKLATEMSFDEWRAARAELLRRR
jgi:hypothetical protein